MPARVIIIVVFGAISLILIGIVAVLIWRIIRLRRTGHRVRGQCVNVYSEENPFDRSSFRRLWFSTVSFTAPDGGRYRLEVQTRGHTLGQWIPVLVPPDDPGRARVDEPWQLWWAPALIGMISLVFVLATMMVSAS